MEIAGRAAIVTGAAAGIGRGIASRLHAEGATVLLVDRDADAVSQLAAEFGPKAAAHVADITGIEAAPEIASACAQQFGGVDILVNNAGGVVEPFFPDNDVAQWLGVIQLNLVGVMAMTQAVIPFMTERGGAIVNIASAAALGNSSHAAPEYAAAKAGVVRLTTALSGLAETRGVRVDCICPDWVDTPASRQTKASMTAAELATVPPVLLTPDQIATAVQHCIEHDESTGRVLAWWCGEDTWRIVE